MASIAKSKEEFDKAAEGLNHRKSNLLDELICIEPINTSEFTTFPVERRCIVRSKSNGRLYLSRYDWKNDGSRGRAR